MNPSKKPINQNSLQSLELWLTDLGAVKDINNPSKWYLLLSNWNATIIFKQEDLELINSLIPQYPQRAVQENDGEHLAAVGLLLY